MMNTENFHPTVISLLLLLLFLNFGCKKAELFEPVNTDGNTIVNNLSIDPAFNSYVESFITEGKKRGFNIDLEIQNVTIQFTKINQSQNPNVAGQCLYDGHNVNDITIDASFWNQSSVSGKEFVIFHELGHCYLERAHSNGAFSNGICQSIMRGGASISCQDAYNNKNRDYYLDELFSIQGGIGNSALGVAS